MILNSFKRAVFIFSVYFIRAKGLQTISVLSWNVNGLRSLFKHDKDGRVINSLIESKKPDFICLQETKLQEIYTEEMELKFKELLCIDIKLFWNCSRARKGYSGTGSFFSFINII